MNTILISILAFIIGLIIGVLAMIGLNTLKLKKDASLALGIIEQAKKDAEKRTAALPSFYVLCFTCHLLFFAFF